MQQAGAIANDLPLYTCNPDDFSGIDPLTSSQFGTLNIHDEPVTQPHVNSEPIPARMRSCTQFEQYLHRTAQGSYHET